MNFSMPALRETLSRIFFGDADEAHLKYIIPLTGNWVVPTADPAEKVSTWIGYQIVSIKPMASTVVRNDILLKECKIYVRLWATGEQAYDFMKSTLFWDDRVDVRSFFDKYLGRLLEGGREIISQVYEQDGLNNMLCWMTDMLFGSYIFLDRKGDELKDIEWRGEPYIRNLPERDADEPRPPIEIDEFKKLFT